MNIDIWDDFVDLSSCVQNDMNVTYKIKKRENAQVINNRYVIGDFLGEGVSAKVYEALDMTSLQRRALKIYEFRRIFKLPNSEEREEMINTELNLLTKLNHANLIKYVDVFTNKNECTSKRDFKVYAFMDYCICSIDDLIESYRNHRIPLTKCHKYFCELIDAVNYLHCNSIVHKDIKIANILLTVCDHIKLTDLGVCEIMNKFNDKCFCYKTNGSFIYQAPEMFDLDSVEFPAFSIDVWACGVTLYFMATGKYPFEGTLLELVSKISTKEVTYPDFIMNNIQLIDLFERIFKKNPIERITIDGISQHNWFRSLPGRSKNRFNLKLNSHVEEINVMLKPRTKYDDFYRSMSMTPYIHQMYYPIHDNVNVIQLNENEIDEFENLKKIPIVRGNRRKDFVENEDDDNEDIVCKKKSNSSNFDSRILKVVGSNVQVNPKLLAKITSLHDLKTNQNLDIASSTPF